ncbi:MAG TPA: cytochrome c, partial [Gammaproteobacteria bacterium]|nr:cytochrome c [Gammaproteobacteria bacterium]
MNKFLNRFTLLGALSALGLTACGGGGGQALDPNAPGVDAYIYRHSLMEVVAHQMGVLNDMARGKIPADEAKFKTAATDLATLSTMVPGAYMPKPAAIPAQSRALPAIWMNTADFNMKAQALQDSAKMVADSAQSGGIENSKGTVQQLARTCGDCHRTY